MNQETVLQNVMDYLSNGLHTLSISLTEPDGHPYSKTMDILTAEPFGGIYIYGENTEKVDECIRQCPYISFSCVNGCAFSHIRGISFSGRIEKVDPMLSRELLSEDQHYRQHAHHTASIGIYHIVSGSGIYEDVNLGKYPFTL